MKFVPVSSTPWWATTASAWPDMRSARIRGWLVWIASYQIAAVHAGHDHVGEHQMHGADRPLEHVESLRSALRDQHAIAQTLENGAGEPAHMLIVLHEQDALVSAGGRSRRRSRHSRLPRSPVGRSTAGR